MQLSIGYFSLSILISIFCNTLVHAQINENDPFFRNYLLGQNSEILTINGGSDSTLVRIYDSNGNISTDGISLINSIPINSPWGIVGDSSSASVDLLTADFNGDGFDDFLGAWPGPDSTLTLYFSEINPNTFDFQNSLPVSIQDEDYPNLYVINEFDTKSIIRLELAQIDDDAKPEIILAYWADDNEPTGGSIQIIVLEIADDGQLQIIHSISDIRLSPNVEDADNTLIRSTKFEITAADFDGDETDELALLSVKPGVDFGTSSDFGWQLVATIYDFEDGQIKNVGGSTSPILRNDGENNEYIQRMALTSGDYNGDVIEELGLGIGEGITNASNFRITTYSLIVEPDFSNVSIADDLFNSSTSGIDGWPMSMTTGDMDLDGIDEMLLFYQNRIRIYKLDNSLVLDWVGGTSLGSATQENQRFHRTIALTDVDITESDSLRFEVVSIDDNGLKVWQNVKENDPGTDGIDIGGNSEEFVAFNSNTAIALSVGDFDGDAVKLGAPNIQTVTDIVQPLVVLNAPPIHFDIFDEQAFDINNCFNLESNQNCEHRAIYENATSQELEVSTEVSTDWGVSASVTGEVGAQVGPVSGSISATLSGAYGEGFSKLSGTSTNVTVKVTSDAIDDDRIYATISNYDIYEYPVFSDNEITGYVVVVNPTKIGLESLENTWFGSKSGLARDYINSHEIGNILSYPSSANLPFGASFFGNGGLEGGGGDTWELSNSSTQTWELRFSSESISQRTNSSSFEIGASVTATGSVGFGPVNTSLSATVSAEFSSDQISTHKTTIKEESALLVEFGTIDGSILGSKTYTVSPFVYWSGNGALVLDYAVNPDISAGVASWWEDQYGNSPDLSFILPWKYDEQKGFGSTNPELQKEETRDIIFFPSKPLPNTVADIQVRVQNFSLTDALIETKLKLFVGDPRNGGVSIKNTNGDSLFSIPPIGARDNKIVTVSGWQVPDNVGGDTFIYAQIDTENSISEIHENNNIAWVLLNETLPISVSNENVTESINEFKLHQNYPNPFNPTTNISYSLQTNQNVVLVIFDIMGRKVSTLVNERQHAGSHNILFDASNLSSGIYLYRLSNNEFSLSKKMVLLK
ncbi:MAG: hypothetical protein BalsKO_16280 [Balneolaceae bacterium]